MNTPAAVDKPLAAPRIWLAAMRPKTLPAAIAPVVVGTAMAAKAGGLHLPSALCALLGALLIQVGTNFANDYADCVKGADQPDRLGPLRVTQAGLVTPAAMRAATAAAFLAACLPGLYIVYRGGWPFIAIGLASIACGILYTAGPFPLGYIGLADIFVLVFFGPVAVGGTYYVQTRGLTLDVVLAGLAAGLISVAILTVNNLRDIEQDRRANKKTLAVRFGRGFARLEYAGALALAAIAVPAILYFHSGRIAILLPVFALAAAVSPLRTVLTCTDGPRLNAALAGTGKLLLLWSLLFSMGWML